MEWSGEDTAEVYITGDPLEIGIAQSILEEAGFDSRVRDFTLKAYPSSLGNMGEYRLAVSAAEAAEARGVLKEAFADGVLLNGSVID